MILTETHLHTSSSSTCGKVKPAHIPALYDKAGFKAITVTDHYHKNTRNVQKKNADEWLNGYRSVREAAKPFGIKVFLGMELRLNSGPEDFLVYGFDENFLIKNNTLFNLTLEELFEVAESYGLLVYQAHPFRKELKVCKPHLLHGFEVYNGNPRWESHNRKAKAYAEKHGLLQIAGSDFHMPDDEGRGGIYIDESIENEKELVQFLKTQPRIYSNLL